MRNLVKKIYETNREIFNLNNFVLITCCSVFICALANKGVYIEDRYYKYNVIDIIFEIISDPRRVIFVLGLFFIIKIYMSLYVNNCKYFNLIRYTSKTLYYRARVKKIIIFILFFHTIFFINVVISALIKGNISSNWSQSIQIISHSQTKYSNLIYMNPDIVNANPYIQLFCYIFIIILFFLLIGIFMETMNIFLKNTHMAIVLTAVLFLFTSYNAFNTDTNNFAGVLIYNHIDINRGGFRLSNKLYIDLIISMLYILALDIFVYLLGKYIAFMKASDL